jgi:lycopene cyclase CruA
MAAVSPIKIPNLPALSDFRRRYPLTVAGLGALANREAWLRRVWELDEGWRQSVAEKRTPPEVVVTDAPPAGLEIEATFDIIYGGGVLGLLHAATLTHRHNFRVLVFDAHAVGKTHRDWNISDEELRQFTAAGLFTPDEIEASVVNHYRAGFVKFHDANSRVKAPPLWMENVLDVAVDADALLGLAARKVREASQQNALVDGLRFVRAYTGGGRVCVETEDVKTGRRRLFAARLFVDALGTNSPASRQLNAGQSITHVCPTVGTVARGFVRGPQPDEVDFSVGEILVSNEDAADHRQLIWEGFAGAPARDDYTTYLFFYDAVDSPAEKSLLELFERYFEKLPRYKRPGAQWRVAKPVFGYIPSYHHSGPGNHKRTAANRVLLVGDAAGLSSPLTFCGFGSHVRNLKRLTELTAQALTQDALDAASLADINAYEPRVAQMASLAEFMRPLPRSRPHEINETMNAVMDALHALDESVRRELFQDRMTFAALKQLLGRTAKTYPAIFLRLREHLGVRGTLRWLMHIAQARRHERQS